VTPDAIRASTKMANDIGSAPFWFGYSIDFWGWISSKLLVAAVITGIFAAVTSGLSSWIGSAVTTKVQDMAGTRLTAAELELQKSLERTTALGVAVADANARAAESNRIAESERLERMRIEAGLASRHAQVDRASKLTEAFSAIKDRVPVVRIVVIGDKEASDFGKDITSAIGAAGVQVQLTSIGVMGPPAYGVQVRDAPAGLIVSAFEAADIAATATDNLLLPGRILAGGVPIILVGLKPPAF
jgi:hypothetical protein